MNRRHFLALSTAAAAAAQSNRRPNFVFILSDDHHFKCLGAAGNPNIQTPVLDKLAARGMLFANATISTAQCAPSRGVLLSGLETYQNGLKSNGATRFHEGAPPTAISQLRRSGYDTVLVGKWHIAETPADCGFSSAPLWLREGGSKYIDPLLIRGLEGTKKQEPAHITDLFTAAAVEQIRASTKPFFLWLAYNAPHTPWSAPGKYTRPYQGKSNADLAPPDHPRDAKPFDWSTYYAVITHLDEAIGRVLGAIEESGKQDNTVVVFIGDNGYLCGTRGLNGKVFPWEASVRVPMIIAGGTVKRGVRIEDPVASIDLPATWLDYAGVKPASKLAGRSLRRVLETGSGGPSEAFSVWDDGRVEALAIRRAVEPYRLVRTRRHKLIVWESGKQSLYDHVADPAETTDLIGDPEHRATADELRRLLRDRMQATGDHAATWLVRR